MIRTSLSLPARMALVSLGLSLLLVVVMVLGLAMGSSDSSFDAVWSTLFRDGTGDTMQAAIIWRIRLPRVLLAALVGAALSLGGLVFQALLKNPLAEPYILGISVVRPSGPSSASSWVCHGFPVSARPPF